MNTRSVERVIADGVETRKFSIGYSTVNIALRPQYVMVTSCLTDAAGMAKAGGGGGGEGRVGSWTQGVRGQWSKTQA